MEYISVSEYARLTGKDPGNIRRMLAAGRLQGRKDGRKWLIAKNAPYPEDGRINSGRYKNWRNRPYLHADRSLSRTIGTMVSELKNIYGECLRGVVLYGSYARGDQNEESDVDIALLLSSGHSKEMYNKMIDNVARHELECGKVLSVLDIDYEKYNRWKSTLPFYKNIEKEGIPLWMR